MRGCCGVLWVCALTMLATAEDIASPRIALLFSTVGNMPLESYWREFLNGVQGLQAPHLTPAQEAAVQQKSERKELGRMLDRAGTMQSFSGLARLNCISASNLVVRSSVHHTGSFAALIMAALVVH